MRRLLLRRLSKAATGGGGGRRQSDGGGGGGGGGDRPSASPASSTPATPPVVSRFRRVNTSLIPESLPAGVLSRLRDVHGYVDSAPGAKSGDKSAGGKQGGAPVSGTSVPELTLLWRAFDQQLDELVRYTVARDSGSSSGGGGGGAPSPATYAPGFVMHGPAGVGKSAALLQLVERCRADNWLVMYLPDAHAWAHGAGFYTGVYENGMQGLINLDTPLFYERAREVLALVRHFRMAHAAQLRDIACTDDLSGTSLGDEHIDPADTPSADTATTDTPSVPAKGGSSSGSSDSTAPATLLDAADAILALERRLGTEDEQSAVQRIGSRFRHLLRQLQTVRDARVLIAIDEWNHLSALTSFRNANGRLIHASAMRSIRPFMAEHCFTHLGRHMRNGLVVCACTQRYPRMYERASRIAGSRLYRPTEAMARTDVNADARTTQQHEQLVSGEHLLRVPRFARDETFALLSDFASNGVFRNAEDAMLWRLHALSDGNGEKLLRLCRAA